jgi:branched-chain amino acid transport system substrate-binding protein
MRAITRPWCLIVALGVVGVLAVAGCGATSSSSSSSSSTTAEEGGSTTASSSSGSSTQCGGGEALTSAPKAIEGMPEPNPGMEEFGQSESNECVYEGPGNFSVDVSKCPSNWNINQGITENSIKLFTSAPHSGALAAYGAIEDGAKSYFDYLNENGGVDGRKVEYEIMDDQYEPAITAQNVNKAMQSGDYASSFAVFGTPNNLAVRDTMNKGCEGQYMVATSDGEFFDPQNYPWTTGFGIDRYNETEVWAEFLEEKFPKGVKAVMITMEGDLGESYASNFERAAKGTDIEIVGNEIFPATAPSIKNQMTTAAATNAEVVILNVAGTYCTEALAELEKSSWKPTSLSANTCAQISTTYAPLLEAGATGNGSFTTRYYAVPGDNDVEAPEYVALYEKTLKEQGLEPSNTQYANGWWWAWDFTQVLEDAARMKGGLNRATINIAAHSYTSNWPLLMKGVEGKMEGVEKAFPYQTAGISEYTGATSSETGEWKPAGPLRNHEGEPKNYQEVQEEEGA